VFPCSKTVSATSATERTSVLLGNFTKLERHTLESLLHQVVHTAVQPSASNLFHLNYSVGCTNSHQFVMCCT